MRRGRAVLAADNAREPGRLRRVSSEEIAAAGAPVPASLREVWRSRKYLVQVHVVVGGVERLSVQRTELDAVGRWRDGIPWEDLQRLKAECGRGGYAAVEIYPPDGDVVNVANMRHLWVLPFPPAFMWRQREERER